MEYIFWTHLYHDNYGSGFIVCALRHMFLISWLKMYCVHRRWVLQRLQKECSPSGQELKDPAESRRQCERLQRALQEEMKVCADAAGRYPSNYNAWSHRIWVLQNMAEGNLKVGRLSPPHCVCVISHTDGKCVTVRCRFVLCISRLDLFQITFKDR